MTAQISHEAYLDPDPGETEEWLLALASVITREGSERAEFLLKRQLEFGSMRGLGRNASGASAYLNTITPEHERAIRATRDWNDGSKG